MTNVSFQEYLRHVGLVDKDSTDEEVLNWIDMMPTVDINQLRKEYAMKHLPNVRFINFK